MQNMSHIHQTCKRSTRYRPYRQNCKNIFDLTFDFKARARQTPQASLRLFDWSFRASRLLSTFMIIFFMLVDTLFTQCALKCKKMCNTDDVIK